MGTTKLFQRGVLVLGLAVLFAGYGLAAERAPATDASSFGDANAATPPMMGMQSADLVRASRVMHARVKSSDGTTLGRVYDLVLTPDLKGVSYVALSRGGILGVGNALYAIPWTALSHSVNGTFAVPITEQQLKQSRGFRPAYWPTSTSLQAPIYQDETASENKRVQQRRFSRIKGMNAKGSQGTKVGDIHDLVIAMDTGQIAYTILSSGGLLGLGSRFAAVPENAITMEPAIRLARVDATKATVQAHSFTPGRWPDLASPSYSQQVAAAYGVAPAGTALAYVPPEGTTAVARAPRTTTTPSARSTTPPVSGTTPTPMGEPTPAELTGTFNASSITTVDGTVIGVGKFQPTSGSEMLWLRVRPESGQPVLVNLGPRSYISAQDFYIVPGDRIHLSGSQVAATASGKQVFLPTEVTYNGHTLRLRSATGTPLWEGQGMTPAGQKPTTSEQSKAGAAATPPLGYTPAESEATTGTSTAAGQTPTQFTPSSIIAAGAVDLSNSRTIEGTVTEVGKSQPAGGGSDVIWLRVRTTSGQFVNVQAGPRDYLSRQNFFVVSGDRVRMTGWNARSSGAPGATPVFILADISQNGQTLQLRNRNGEPLWTSQAGIAGQSRATRRPAAEPNEPNEP